MFVIIAPAQIINVTPAVSAALNTSTAITCLYSGIPEPVVRWYRNGTELLEDKRLTIHPVVGKSTVTINNLMKKDSGIYTCFVSNENGTEFDGNATASTTLNVFSKCVCVVHCQC